MNSQTKAFHAMARSGKGFAEASIAVDPPGFIPKSALRYVFAPWRLGVLLVALVATPFVSQIHTQAQQPVDTIRINTRVVFMDALVKDKRTGVSISDLNPENFEVFDDGKPRAISYFSREGQARKPLALMLVLDLRDDGAGRFLKREEVRKSIVDELTKLPPGDE